MLGLACANCSANIISLSWLFSAACTSDDELTLEEFYQQAKAIDADFEVEIEEVYESFPDDGEETDENLQAEKAAFGEIAAIWDEFFDELGALNPPAEAEEAFDEFYASSEALEESLDELVRRGELIRLGKIARLDCLLEGEAVDALNTQIVHLETVVGNELEFALGMAQLAYLEERADTASENARITCERFYNARR